MHSESIASVKEEKSGDDSFSEKNGSNIFDEVCFLLYISSLPMRRGVGNYVDTRRDALI